MSAENSHRATHASGWKRILAFGADYVCVLCPYVIVLGLIGYGALQIGMSPFDPATPIRNQLIVLAVFTFPVVMFFGVSEGQGKSATPGKRWQGLKVVTDGGADVTLQQALLRAVVKFLPWECFHTMLWQWEGWPMNPAEPTMAQIVGLTAGWIVIMCYILMMFVCGGRTPYDRVSGTMVVCDSQAEHR